MRSVVVVDLDELVELVLQRVDRGSAGLAGEPFLEGLVEPFDFAAGGGVVGPGVLLGDVQGRKFGLERVAAAASSDGRPTSGSPVVENTDVRLSARSGCAITRVWAIIPPIDAPTM